MKTAYILESFPLLSTTFIINEIIAMQEKNVDVEVFAFIKPKGKISHEKLTKIKNVNYFKSKQYYKIFFYNFYWLLIRPHRYLYALLLAVNPKYQLFKLFFLSMPYIFQVYLKKPDLLHAHFGKRPADFCMLVRLITGIPFTFTTHGFDVHREPPKDYFLKSLLSHKHITISEFNKKIMINKFHVPENKIEIIRCGMDFQKSLPKRKNDDENTIVSVARLEYIKGLDVLVRACKKLADDMIDFKCFIIGDGPEKNHLIYLISRLGLERKVFLLGALSNEQVFKLIAKSKLMVLPSRCESLSVSLMEGMVCCIPVIGPNLMGNPELIKNGEWGFLVNPDDEDDLFNKIKIMLKNKLLRQKFSINAYLHLKKNFNLKTETDKLLKIWQEAKNSTVPLISLLKFQ